MNLQKKISIIAGLITALTLAYTGLAPVWGLPLETEIERTGAVLVVLLSGILSAFTGQKLLENKQLDETVNAARAVAKENVQLRDDGAFRGISRAEEVQAATPEGLLEKHQQFEADGGQGAVYSVPIGSYDQFRNAVIGRGYDIDGYYGYQCWDGAALLWQQLGRSLSTGGTGAAKGCWTHARQQNAGSDFDIVTDRNALKRGDVVVFDGGQYGHIGFVDSVNGDGTINILGQNQNGSSNGSPFNVIRMSLANFLGAFRLKRWIVVTPTQTPTPQPTPKPVQPAPDPTPKPTPTVPNNPVANDDIKVGDTVIAYGVGTADSYGGGQTTRDFPETKMKVIGINNGRYGLNQYNEGTPGNVPDVTAWWTRDKLRKG